jgi:uncharacterized protein (TIGR02145 family)
MVRILSILLLSTGLSAGTPPEPIACGEPVTDIDGQVYSTVRNGEQCWMAENLKTGRYRDGTPIPNVTDAARWARLTSGAWANYDNQVANDTTYGKLYNWHAVNDSRGLCPIGWHVATDAEWTALAAFIDIDPGHMMKSATAWNGLNASGLNALPAGNRRVEGGFFNIGRSGVFWTSTGNGADMAWSRSLLSSYRELYRYSNNKKYGYSVRCVMD